MASTNYLTSSVILFLICMLMEMTGCDQILSPNDGTESVSNGLDDLTEHPRKARFLAHHVHHVYPHHPLGSVHHGYGYGGYHGGLHHGGYGGYHGYHGYHGLHARQAEGNANNNNNNNINCNKGISQGQPWGVLLSGSIPLNPNQQFNPIAGFQTTKIDYNSLPTTAGMGVNVVGNQIQTNPMGMHPVPVINIPAPISIPGFYGTGNGDSNLKSHWSILTSAANRPSFSNVYGTNSIQPNQLTLMKYGPGIVIGTKDLIGTNNVYGLNNALVPGTYKDVSILTNEISPYIQYTGNDLNGKYNGYQRHREEPTNSSISQGRTTMQDISWSSIANKEDIGLSSKSQSDTYSNFNKTHIDENNPSKNITQTSDMHTNNKIQNSSNKQNSSNSIHNKKLEHKDEFRSTNNVGTDSISAINENVEKKETNSSEDISMQPDSIAMNEMMFRNTPPLPILGYYGSNLGDSLYLQNTDLARTPFREPDGGLHIDLLNAGTTFLGTGNGIPVYQLSYRGGKSGMNDQKMQVGRLLNQDGRLLNQDGNIMPNQVNIGIGFQEQNPNHLKLWPANNIQNYDQNGVQFGYVSIPMDQLQQSYFQGYARVLRSLAETSKNDKQDSTENSTETIQK